MLPDLLPRWRVRYLADGVGLTPPEGADAGAIRIRERVMPLARMRDVLAAARAELAGEVDASPIEPFATLEGELAAIATITARGAPARTIALVWGDHFYTRIDGVARTLEPAVVARGVRDLAYYHALGLGELRRRRFEYAPPPGWRAYPRGLATEWFPPGYPNRAGFLSVFAARPLQETAATELDRVLHEMSWFAFAKTRGDGPFELATDPGLTGQLWRLAGQFGSGPPTAFEIAVLRDARFSYTTRLESHDPDDRERFAALVRSIRPLPAPVRPRETPFGHWVA